MFFRVSELLTEQNTSFNLISSSRHRFYPKVLKEAFLLLFVVVVVFGDLFEKMK